MKQTTGNNYRQRLTRVIDYIHDHLDRDLDVNTLADVAIMSPYHFHRIYREMAQETVNATVRRLRLQQAAVELIRSDQPILAIAKKISYQSLEAFSRAFTKQFGETPSEYRESKAYVNLKDHEPFIAMLPTQQKVFQHMYTVDLVDIEETNLVGYPHQGDYMNIGQAFEKLFIDAGSKGLLDASTRSLGIYYDDPKSVPESQLRSMACIATANNANLDNVEKVTIPKGKCATVLFKGSYAELEKPYDWLFGHWLPESGYEAANFPAFEEYLNDPKTTPPSELLTRIHCLLE